ncbi:MAG: DUF192 domain-containing protein [Myxococcales bacterium]|nr:MAG: DUF192 domain-containing protein [Myxococcales bacterium]
MKKAIAILLVAAGVTSCGDSQSAQWGRLLDADGNVLLELEIAIAQTEYERHEGLRLHGPLAPNEGLLLVFPEEGRVCITNAGVPFPIDVIYLSADRQVIAIERNIPANAPGPYCHPTTQLVLELEGDTLPPFNYAKLELF